MLLTISFLLAFVSFDSRSLFSHLQYSYLLLYFFLLFLYPSFHSRNQVHTFLLLHIFLISFLLLSRLINCLSRALKQLVHKFLLILPYCYNNYIIYFFNHDRNNYLRNRGSFHWYLWWTSASDRFWNRWKSCLGNRWKSFWNRWYWNGSFLGWLFNNSNYFLFYLDGL